MAHEAGTAETQSPAEQALAAVQARHAEPGAAFGWAQPCAELRAAKAARAGVAYADRDTRFRAHSTAWAAALRLFGLMNETATAKREQSTGVGQVGVAVQELDRATQQNAALVEATSAASDSLPAQAGRLAHDVAFFRLS
jgi:hypothetical protein